MCSLATGKLLIGFPETCKHQLTYTAGEHQRGGNGLKMGEEEHVLGNVNPNCLISCFNAGGASLFQHRGDN